MKTIIVNQNMATNASLLVYREEIKNMREEMNAKLEAQREEAKAQ